MASRRRNSIKQMQFSKNYPPAAAAFEFWTAGSRTPPSTGSSLKWHYVGEGSVGTVTDRPHSDYLELSVRSSRNSAYETASSNSTARGVGADVYHCCTGNSGTRHWCEHGDFQCTERRSDQAAALSAIRRSRESVACSARHPFAPRQS